MIGALGAARVRRLGRTLSAQLYGQFVTIAVQIALVPLLLHAWGTTVYGAWLVLSAVPFYLTFSDLGFTFVAKNAMVMAVASGRHDEALRVYQSIFALLAIALPLLMAASIVLILALDVPALLSVTGVSPAAARTTLLLLIGNVLLYQLFLLICAGIRAENRPASEAIWAASGRLGDGVVVALAALAGGGIVAAALAMVVMRLAFVAASHGWLRRRSDWLRLGTRHASWAVLGPLWQPALSYTLLPLAQAMLIQGPVLVVGGVLGAAATVVFATTRTVARLGTAAMNMVNNSVTAEYAALAGAGDRAGAARLFRAQAGVSLAIVLAYAVAVGLLAPVVLPWLTHGTVDVIQPFFVLIVAGVAAEMLWSALFAPVAAINRHRGVTIAFAIVATTGVAGCGVLGAWLGLTGIAVALLAAQAAMVPICLFAWRTHGR